MRDIRVLLAVDSFKGSAGSSRVEDLIELGVRRVRPGAEVLKYPVADGGEGTLEAIMTAQGFQGRSVRVRGPLGEPVSAKYALGPGQVAVIEMAQSSGLGLMDQSSENARKASTYGVG
ncbi:glycerate kinase, partial [Bifidobacterium actinocoloniiforme]